MSTSIPAADIRDIRGLIPIPAWWQHWPVAAGVVVVLAALALFFWYRRHCSASALTPEERASAALTLAERLAREGRCREWAEVVAGTLRGALAERLGQDSCPQTTSELAAVDWSTRPAGTAIDAPRLIELLSACDVTRFALGRLDTESLLSSTQSARAWVEQLFAPPEAPSLPAAEVTP